MGAKIKDAEGKWVPVEGEKLKKLSSSDTSWYSMRQQEPLKKIKGKWVSNY